MDGLDLKPEILGPAYPALSTTPQDDFNYYYDASVASAYVAGVAALYIGKFGGRSVHGSNFAKDLHARIIASGQSAQWYDGVNPDSDFWATPAQAGNGMVDAVKVLESKTALSLDTIKFNLNDTHHFSRYHGLEITNNDNVPVTYTFKQQEGAGAEVWWTSDDAVELAPRMKNGNEIVPTIVSTQVRMPSGTFTVQPGQMRKAE